MTKTEIFEKLIGIINTEFPESDTEITRETVAEDVPGWDSMAHVGVMAAIEDAFEVKFTGREIVQFEDVGSLLDLLTQKVQG